MTHKFKVGDVVELSGNFTYLRRHWEMYEREIHEGGNRGVITSAHVRDGDQCVYQITWDGWNSDVYSDESCLGLYNSVDEKQIEEAVASILQSARQETP